MTKLTKPVQRETAKTYSARPVIVTLSPCGDDEALIGLRLKGTRTQYTARLSDVYRLAALWHGQAEATAKRQARKLGVPWRTAKKQFEKGNL
jgi:hypothetical protein